MQGRRSISLVLLGLFAGTGTVHADDCCVLPVTWHTWEGSRYERDSGELFDLRAVRRLQRRLMQADQSFRKHGICLEWQQGNAVAGARRAFVGGDKKPQVKALESAAIGASARPAIVFVHALRVWDAMQNRYEPAVGMTPRVGADVAVVRLRDDSDDRVAVENELFHILGLSDAELGVTEASPAHRVRPAMWAFMRRVCHEGRGHVIKDALIRAKDACRATVGSESVECYRQR